MNSRRGRPTPLKALGAFLLGGLVVGGAAVAVYVFLVNGSLGNLVNDFREADAYARKHIEIAVKEVRDPGGLWQTIPVELTVYNDGPQDLVKLEVSATFLDEEDKLVWRTDASQELRVASESERTLVWKFIVGQTLGSDVARANRVRTAKIEPRRAWTTAPDDDADPPLTRAARP